MIQQLPQLWMAWLPVCIWCGVIYFFSSIPNLRIEQIGIFDLIFRKITHLVEFAVLSILFFRAFKKSSGKDSNRWLIWSGFLSIVYAVSDEYHQYFVPGRCPAFRDVMIDSIGAVGGVILYRYFKKNQKIERKYEKTENN